MKSIFFITILVLSTIQIQGNSVQELLAQSLNREFYNESVQLLDVLSNPQVDDQIVDQAGEEIVDSLVKSLFLKKATKPKLVKREMKEQIPKQQLQSSQQNQTNSQTIISALNITNYDALLEAFRNGAQRYNYYNETTGVNETIIIFNNTNHQNQSEDGYQYLYINDTLIYVNKTTNPDGSNQTLINYNNDFLSSNSNKDRIYNTNYTDYEKKQATIAINKDSNNQTSKEAIYKAQKGYNEDYLRHLNTQGYNGTDVEHWQTVIELLELTEKYFTDKENTQKLVDNNSTLLNKSNLDYYITHTQNGTNFSSFLNTTYDTSNNSKTTLNSNNKITEFTNSQNSLDRQYVEKTSNQSANGTQANSTVTTRFYNNLNSANSSQTTANINKFQANVVNITQNQYSSEVFNENKTYHIQNNDQDSTNSTRYYSNQNSGENRWISDQSYINSSSLGSHNNTRSQDGIKYFNGNQSTFDSAVVTIETSNWQNGQYQTLFGNATYLNTTNGTKVRSITQNDRERGSIEINSTEEEGYVSHVLEDGKVRNSENHDVRKESSFEEIKVNLAKSLFLMSKNKKQSGGWQEMNVQEMLFSNTEIISEAIAAVNQKFNPREQGYQFDEVIGIREQIVAGFNYNIHLRYANENNQSEDYQVLIYSAPWTREEDQIISCDKLIRN